MLTAFFQRLSQLPRNRKQAVLVFVDIVSVMFGLWVAYSLRFDRFYVPLDSQYWLWIAAPVLALPVFIYFDLYRAIIRYMGFQALWSLFKAVSLYALLWGIFAFLSGLPLIPRTVVFLNWLICLLLVMGGRLFVRWYFVGTPLMFNTGAAQNHKNVIVYGAGAAGVQLALLLHYEPGRRAIAYIDDNAELHGHYVNGLVVMSPDQVGEYLKHNSVDEILLAIPSLARKRRKQILEELEPLPVKVRTLPAVSEIAQGRVKIDDIRNVDIADLLGREAVAPDEALLDANIRGCAVMVTGGGGSIGSELCRQIIARGPAVLIIYELSEYGLYQIEQELNSAGHHNIVCVLGSVVDEKRMKIVCWRYAIDTIYHAAAYKHVPMIESNPVMGVENNIFGTLHAARAAIETKVKSFVLISTDKAVRPTNVMGATKRFAELTLQALNQALHDEGKQQDSTRFSMVRFGNVLGSSGSVVPLFREQIRKGGPITVTAEDMVRYFMTIEEAALLVIQAGAMGRGGDVFVLDMGKPVLIMDLAKKMIRLSGLEVQDDTNPDGDIRIEVTGLRPGEKLYEELLISGNPKKTKHRRIFEGNEEYLPLSRLDSYLDDLEKAIQIEDTAAIQKALLASVKGYQPKSILTDVASSDRKAVSA